MMDKHFIFITFSCDTLTVVSQQQLPVSKSTTFLSIHPDPSHCGVLIVTTEGTIYAVEQPQHELVRREGSVAVYQAGKCFCSVVVRTQLRQVQCQFFFFKCVHIPLIQNQKLMVIFSFLRLLLSLATFAFKFCPKKLKRKYH